MGRKSLEKIEGINDEIKKEVDQKREKMRLNNFKPNDLKKLMTSTHVQQKTIDSYIKPKVQIDDNDMSIAASSLIDNKEV